ncbi:binding-protein-dependent transporters inner membrane component [Halosimplex carlsbadense 2-9-1]|uniref:Binding-protein-dependent transporters inner membrane component n=1 Tax=Halosimplex carlsbadense 2-9-1 TaxID=797114 RepID=M0CDW7_9EURY|nr:binding-protein-dependent transporters inner membrane component [Halosimplex carlsbadense 2-9-1]
MHSNHSNHDDSTDTTGAAEMTLQRIREQPRPALVWVGVATVLFALEFGAVASLVAELWQALGVGRRPSWLVERANAIPTLTSRDLITNAGYFDGDRWVGTFAGLEPRTAWLLRVGLVYAYAVAVVGWCWVGYRRYRRHYRPAEWTPLDDVVDRLRRHRWGQFGMVVVFLFLVLAVFAPTLGTTTVDQNINNPFGHQIEYYDAETGSIESITVGTANRQTQSRGIPDRNVGPFTYDQYGRYHPFGTLPSGKDLFTFLAAGARVSLVISLLAVGLASVIAVSFALLSAYYKGLIDLVFVIGSDSVMSLPQLLLLMLLSVLFSDTWIGQLYSGGILLALIYGATSWPFLWRALRGPALQVGDEEWIDAARSYGQRPITTMRRHMFPYVTGYLLVYGSMSLGGAIIAIAGLSFLGLGISPPTPEWGRAVDAGQQYVASHSWHISLIPGLLITLVVTGFNALGDGIRDAIDPQTESGSTDSQGAAVGGGA